ncbi:matrilysin-like [Lytechinus variegatus]|uniref:matrilysin-like n=1 Tax=Lytechinus variegatus TaxID=7654 RepID=UPI001BB23759|nr:matrilysin-like [Lytechinus variegatus]
MLKQIILKVIVVYCIPGVFSAPTRRRTAEITSDPIKYLETYGNLKTSIQHSPTSVDDLPGPFPQFAGLQQTGLLNEATRDKRQAKRCDERDIIDNGYNQQGESKNWGRFTPKGGRWTKNDLTYYFKKYTTDLTRLQTKDAIRRAFQVWADVSPLTFTESSESTADIIIDFVSRDEHSEEYPCEHNKFDGPGGFIAHAFYDPPLGIVHFDEDETFTTMTMGRKGTFDLAFTAAHEIGHVLGLGHSNNSCAVMAPFYRGIEGGLNLHRDDIDGIQYLYGTPDVDVTVADYGRDISEVAKLPSCDTPWDAVTYYAPDDVVYAFKGKFVWAIDEEGALEGYPRKINKVFHGAPNNVHSVVSAGSRTYMFKGRKIWRFFGKQLEPGFPRLKRNSFPSKTDAALVHDGRIYILKGTRYYEFFENDLSIGWSKEILHQWRVLPTRVDSAFQWRNGTTFFFKNDTYWRFDGQKLTGAHPGSVSKDWLGCGLS